MYEYSLAKHKLTKELYLYIDGTLNEFTIILAQTTALKLMRLFRTFMGIESAVATHKRAVRGLHKSMLSQLASEPDEFKKKEIQANVDELQTLHED